MTHSSPSSAADGLADSSKRKERVARWSVLASVALTVGKLTAGILSGSLALFSEAIHSLVDSVATFITWLAIRASSKPADEEHHYGHGKIESVAALAETGILFVLALAVLGRAGMEIWQGGGIVEATPLVFAVVIISIVVDINRIRALNRVAKETGSHALAADVLHFSSDLAGSVMVLLGLASSKMGFLYGDGLAACGVACFIAIAGWRLGKRTLDTLLDAAPKGRAEEIKTLAEIVPGVVAVESVRLRPGGNEIFGEITVAVSRALPLEQVVAIKSQVNGAVTAAFPDTVLTVIVRPQALDSETICERVVLVAQQQRLMIHHVTVQDVGGQLSISFDMEMDGRTSLDAAHDRAESFKAILQQEFGQGTEVEPHVEPMEVDPLEGKNAQASEVEKIAGALGEGAEGSSLIWDIHDVRVRESARGLIVNYHCRASGDLTVTAVHEHMDEIERRVRETYPEIIRIVGHADVRQCAKEKGSEG